MKYEQYMLVLDLYFFNFLLTRYLYFLIFYNLQFAGYSGGVARIRLIPYLGHLVWGRNQGKESISLTHPNRDPLVHTTIMWGQFLKNSQYTARADLFFLSNLNVFCILS